MATYVNLALTATITFSKKTLDITYKDVTELMKAEALKVGLEYTQSNRADNNHWYGIANPLFNILSAFKMKYDEIRIGISKIQLAKEGTQLIMLMFHNMVSTQPIMCCWKGPHISPKEDLQWLRH